MAVPVHSTQPLRAMAVVQPASERLGRTLHAHPAASSPQHPLELKTHHRTLPSLSAVVLCVITVGFGGDMGYMRNGSGGINRQAAGQRHVEPMDSRCVS